MKEGRQVRHGDGRVDWDPFDDGGKKVMKTTGFHGHVLRIICLIGIGMPKLARVAQGTFGEWVGNTNERDSLVVDTGHYCTTTARYVENKGDPNNDGRC